MTSQIQNDNTDANMMLNKMISKIEEMANSINILTGVVRNLEKIVISGQTPSQTHAVQSDDVWLISKNRPRMIINTNRSTNSFTLFKAECIGTPGYFDMYYDPELGRRYGEVTIHTFKALLQDMWDKVKADAETRKNVKKYLRDKYKHNFIGH
ncbi:hypothetical protein E24_00474 [Faustovirus]|nr:hypothetical protein PRJ_Fausto_00446 [Faustovirus]AMN83387.1 hypothetical protein E24_00474 [Faustovirus]AMN84371.1 hypothetical protein D5a_00472 [Faustovirus]AMN85357.1 hypothetical protein E23_00474 [Faustovirus]QBR99351.1 hypothetical protein [Faustovirus mariensis]